MSQFEKKKLAILEGGNANHGIVALKAKFEAECTRADELRRLLMFCGMVPARIRLQAAAI